MLDFPLWVDVVIVLAVLRFAVGGLKEIIKAERKRARKTTGERNRD